MSPVSEQTAVPTRADELPVDRPITLSHRDTTYPGSRVLPDRFAGMVQIKLGSNPPLLWHPSHVLGLVPEPAAPTDPRDAVIAAARALVASWSEAYSASTNPEAVIGGCEGELDAALARLDAVQHSRTDPEAEPTASCPAGVACTGRDGQPSPYACPECRHCSDHAGGCAARTDDGRCGCTGGGAS